MAARETRTPAPSRPGACRTAAGPRNLLAPAQVRPGVLATIAAVTALAASGMLVAARASTPAASLALGPGFHASEPGHPTESNSLGFRSGLAESPSRWLSLSGLAGSTQPDRGLADYQWDTRPHLAWGMKAMAGLGRFGGGLRLWRTRTTQDLGIAGEPDPAVTSTRLELMGSARLANVGGTQVSVTGGGGWLRLAYDPDETTIDTGGSSTVVRFAPIDEWIGGAGLGLRHPLAGPWALGLEVDRQVFALDTAHRSGDEVVMDRSTFAEWSARLELSWTRGW